VSETGPYAADFGPRPAQVEDEGSARGVDSGADPDDIIEVAVRRRVPEVSSTTQDDDPGAIVDRLYWKANIRIIDGVWYSGNSVRPVFNPERDAPGLSNPDPTNDLNHAFARVLRFSWWWDVRENRVYCEGSTTNPLSNCVTDGNEYQRGAQIRATDFDMAAFMALLERADARSKLFPDGVIPPGGVVVYVSETYDPRYEDSRSSVSRSANVRNFLNFPVMHNHLPSAQIASSSGPLTGLVRKSPATAYGDAIPATPHELGWFPENIWGQHVRSLNMESLTRPAAVGLPAESAEQKFANFYANPRAAGSKNGSTCAVPGESGYTESRRPSTRPTSFSTARISPPCTQAGAQPLGPENAVRVVRAHTMPREGFTLVTDNRLYLHGDVNTRSNSSVVSGSFATSQDISGKIAFIADSLTIQSERFDDRRHQSDPGSQVPNFNSFFRAPETYAVAAFTGTTIAAAARLRALPYAQTPTNGFAANVCTALRDDLPFETRINASLLMGDVPACKDTSDSLGNNSGGVNNFPRFVERWTRDESGVSTPLLLNGSMVGLFRSERGNARFLAAGAPTGTQVQSIAQARSGSAYNLGDVCDYRPPQRNWTFDNTLLESIDNLPPGTPRVVATDRLRWVRR
jgi:hypothetical protein